MRLHRYQLPALLLLGTFLLTVSCTGLSENPQSEITEANFNPTTNDIPNLIAPAYTPLRQAMACCFSFIGMQDEAADMFIKPARPNGWGGPFLSYHRHNWDASHLYPQSNWPAFFDGVNATNRVINQVETGVVPIDDEELRTDVLAELRVVRAFYYFLLMDNFGNVPLVTDFGSDEVPDQSSREEVYNFVVDELTSNIPDLPEAVNQGTYGRFTKWAGKTALAEVFLNSEVYVGEARWEDVIEQTNDVIDSGNFILESDYKSNFVRQNQNSEEIVLAVPYDETEAGGNTFHMMTLTAELQQTFQIEATPWGGGAAQPQFANSYDEDDQRLEDTWIRGTQRNPQGDSLITFTNNIPNIESTEFFHGWRVGKYEIYQGLQVSSDVDFPFYRYAEVLMMKAEALLRTGRADEAAEIVTRVRERSFDDPAEAQVTGEELKEPSTINWGFWEDGEVVEPGTGPEIQYGRFLDELGWEFAMEGHRRQDMIRFGAFTTKTWLNNRASNEDFLTIFPIPQDALDTNPNLEQNPGY